MNLEVRKRVVKLGAENPKTIFYYKNALHTEIDPKAVPKCLKKCLFKKHRTMKKVDKC